MTQTPVLREEPRAPDPLAPFSAPVRAWFEAAFAAPTPAQIGGWAAIAEGHNTLIHAPTGSGKTLAAFLWCLDRLARDPTPPPVKGATASVRVLYVSPLKALTYDVERNLRAPLHGIALAAQRLGLEPPHISISSRTGDTPQEVRRQLAKAPPDILVTTPESLYLLLTSRSRSSASSAFVRPGRRHSSGSACRRRSAPSKRSPGSSAGSGRGATSGSSTPARARPSISRSSSPSRT